MIMPMEDGAGRVIGRDPELEAVAAFLAKTGSGFAELTLDGEAGIGKTTVWWEALRLASATGARVLVTRPSESEATLSFAALGDLFDDVDNAMIGELPIPQREAIAAALVRAPAPPGGIDERALCASVLSLLRLMSAQRPLVVGVDDVQWLDPPSARVLSFAVRRLRAEPVALVMTLRTGTAAPQGLDRAAIAGQTRVIKLGPLTLAALHELIKRRTSLSLPRHTLVQIARATTGNALYALEIAAELMGRPADVRVLPVPSSLTDLVAARVGRLPAASRDALLSAAALSQPTIDIVDAAALAPAERAGLVSIEDTRIRFAHPMFASVVYGRAGSAQRQALHRHLAEVVTQPEERARHAALGAGQPDEAIAAELAAAASLAKWRGAPDAAAELMELAVNLTPAADPGSRAARRVAASRFCFDAGDWTRSEAMLQATLNEPLTPRARAEALLLLGELYARRSSFTEATRVTFEALELSGEDLELRAAIELDLAFSFVSLGDFTQVESHAAAALAAAEVAGAPGAVADALGVMTMAEFLCGRGFDEARMLRALQLEDPARVRAWQNRPTFLNGLLLLWTGRLDEALATFGRLHTEILERGEESSMPFMCFYITWAHVWHGDFAAATESAAEALRAAALLDDPPSRGTALSANALLHAHEGSIALARDEALEAVRCFQAVDWPSGTIWPLWALGLAELANGNPAAVDAALGPLVAMVTTFGPLDPVLGVFLPDEIEALVELGRLDEAEPLVAWLEERGGAVDRPWALAVAGRCRGLVLAARGDRDGALAALTQAMIEHDRVALPFDRARTLLVLGRVQRRSGQRGRAAGTLGDALAVFERLGAPVWAARTHDEMARLGGRTAAAGTLTPTENKVAELAASGLSNREIAERAFLTTKAVEANLTRVYSKLGIRSRGGLARALAETPAPE
jgi:DNA-binding CsgD family transcriptional regulator